MFAGKKHGPGDEEEYEEALEKWQYVDVTVHGCFT